MSAQGDAIAGDARMTSRLTRQLTRASTPSPTVHTRTEEHDDDQPLALLANPELVKEAKAKRVLQSKAAIVKNDKLKKKKEPAAEKAMPEQSATPAEQHDGQDKRALYEEWDPVTNHHGKRIRVDPTAHEHMKEKLREWQTQKGANANERPHSNEWYWDLRIAMIKSSMLDRDHSRDVCRSFLKKWAPTQPNTKMLKERASGAD